MLIGAGIGIPFQQNVLARLLGSAEFFAPLTHSAIPTRAASGTTATFTRATTKTWQNNDGYLVTGVAGEIGFVGARRVRNLVAGSSEDISNASWTSGGTAKTVDTADYPTGTAKSTVFSATSSAQQIILTTGRVYICSAWAKGAAGGETIYISDNNGTGGTQAVTTSWTRYSKVFTASVTTALVSVSTGTTVRISGVMYEDITGRADQTTPSEYVSVGVESAPYYHGSMVDGVKCFPTDLSGNPIPAATMLGYSAEGARTNLCLQSNAFTTTWTDISSGATQNVIGPDGATSAWTLTDNSAVAAEGIYQNITLTAAAYTWSVFVKKTTGATTFPLMYVGTGTTAALSTLDTNNGVATAWTSITGGTILAGVSARCSSYNATYWRFELTYTATAAVYFHQLNIASATSATYAGPTIDVSAQGSAVFYGAQVELGSFASSYIPTTTIAVTRNADVLTYSSAGNIDGTKGWCYAEVNGSNVSYLSTDGAYYVTSDTSSDSPILYNVPVPPGKLSTFDGTSIINGDAITANIKGCVSWGGTSRSISVNGGTPVSGAFDGAIITGSSIGIGHKVGGITSAYANIGPIYIGQRQLSASELGAITA